VRHENHLARVKAVHGRVAPERVAPVPLLPRPVGDDTNLNFAAQLSPSYSSVATRSFSRLASISTNSEDFPAAWKRSTAAYQVALHGTGWSEPDRNNTVCAYPMPAKSKAPAKRSVFSSRSMPTKPPPVSARDRFKNRGALQPLQRKSSVPEQMPRGVEPVNLMPAPCWRQPGHGCTCNASLHLLREVGLVPGPHGANLRRRKLRFGRRLGLHLPRVQDRGVLEKIPLLQRAHREGRRRPRPGSDSRRSHIRRRWHHKDGLAKGPGSETRPGLGAAASAAALALTLERLSCSIAHFPRRRAFSTCFVVICKGTTVSI